MTLSGLLATMPGWPGSVTDQQAYDWLHETVSSNRDSMSGNELLSLTNSTEFAALSDHKRTLWISFTARDGVDPFDSAAVALVQYIFGAGSSTVSALSAARTEQVPRWQAEGLRNLGDAASWLYWIAETR